MKALKCDICGKFFIQIRSLISVDGSTRPNYIALSHHAANGNLEDHLRADICPECADVILKTIKGLTYGNRSTTDPFEDDLK
jgi:hypothetical protein